MDERCSPRVPSSLGSLLASSMPTDCCALESGLDLGWAYLIRATLLQSLCYPSRETSSHCEKPSITSQNLLSQPTPKPPGNPTQFLGVQALLGVQVGTGCKAIHKDLVDHAANTPVLFPPLPRCRGSVGKFTRSSTNRKRCFLLFLFLWPSAKKQKNVFFAHVSAQRSEEAL